VVLRVEAYHLRLLCIDSERLPLCARLQFVQHGLHVVRGIGHEAEVICKQHVGHQKKFGSAGGRAFHPICNAINVIQVDGKQQRERVHPCLTPKEEGDTYIISTTVEN